MTHTSNLPIFNLKAVVQETGIKPDTLRAWERRYGLPEPQRADSGHRLYTQRDIDTLKWLLARQDEGLNISRAVALWRQLEQEQQDPLRNGERSSVDSGRPVPVVEASANSLVMLREQWVQACLAFDEQFAEQILTSAFSLLPIETVCLELIQQGIATIGQGWYEGRVTVQQEHFASALALRRLESLLAATPPPTRQGRILVGCPSDEAHTFVPLMLSLLLRRRGWNVIYLGADVPVQSLGVTIATTKPTMVILTAQQLHTAATLLEMADLLQAERLPLGFGGLIFNHLPELRKVIPGYFLGAHLKDAVQAAEQIMMAPRAQQAARPTSAEYRQALGMYRQAKAQIDADVWRSMQTSEMSEHQLSSANTNFGRNIAAALALGDLDFLGPDMEWIEGMLTNHYQIPRKMLTDYLEAYHSALRANVNPPGNIVSDWLGDILDKEAETVAWSVRQLQS